MSKIEEKIPSGVNICIDLIQRVTTKISKIRSLDSNYVRKGLGGSIVVPLFGFTALIQVIWALFLIATHLALTVIVYKDAMGLSHPALGITPLLWLGITFSLPIIGMFIYWIMNYSSLSRYSQ